MTFLKIFLLPKFVDCANLRIVGYGLLTTIYRGWHEDIIFIRKKEL